MPTAHRSLITDIACAMRKATMPALSPLGARHGRVSTTRAAALAFAVLASLASRPARATAADEPLTTPIVQQVREYLAFHADDEWIQTEFRILQGLCDEQERRAAQARTIWREARSGLAPSEASLVDAMAARFDDLARADAGALQEIVLWEIESRRRFDLHYLQNLVARSALNAYRLVRDGARGAAPAAPGVAAIEGGVPAFDARFGTLRTRLLGLRGEVVSGDPFSLDPRREADLALRNAALRQRLASETSTTALTVTDPGTFRSFWEVIRALYDEDFIQRQGFADFYELQQYLLHVRVAGGGSNEPYAVGPFNISRLTAELTKPTSDQPITLPTVRFFHDASPVIRPDVDPLHLLAGQSRRTFVEGELSPRAWKLYQFLRSNPAGKSGVKPVSQEVYETRLFVLTALSDQDFYERYRKISNDKLFFDQAEARLGASQVKALLAEPYALPGGEISVPRYELLEYTPTQFQAETSVRALLARIPSKVHIDFIRPLIVATAQKLDPAEKSALAKQRVGELAQHFGSTVGAVGNRDTLATFFELFPDELRTGASATASVAGVPELTAQKWIACLLTIESRGNLFAVSPTGALGPFQHTYWFYFDTKPPSIPFDVAKSAAKTGSEIGRYYRNYLQRTGSPDEAIDRAVAAYNQGEGAVRAATNSGDWRAAIAPEGRNYVRRFRELMTQLEPATDLTQIAAVLTR